MSFTNKYWMLWTTTDSTSQTQSVETIAWNTVTKLPLSHTTIVTGSTGQFTKDIWYSVQDTGTTHSISDPNGFEMFAYMTADTSVYGALNINSHFGNEEQIARCVSSASITSSVPANTFFAVTQAEANSEALTYAYSTLICSQSSLIPGLLWQIPPITSPNSTDFGCGQMYYSLAVESSDVSASLPGDSSTLYNVTALLRGVSEYGSFHGGSFVGPLDNDGFSTPQVYEYSGGSPDSGDTPTFGLTVSNPSQQYYLNPIPPSGTPPFCILYLNRTFTFTAYGGATIHLLGTNGDGYEIWNDTGVDHQPYVWSDEPVPMQVTQPYNGQFLQMDILSITPA